MSFGEIPDLTGLPGIHIEVKRCEQVRLSEWMQQAETDSKRFSDGMPVVFHRRSREPWRVTMSLANFMDIYSAKFLNSPRKEREKNGTDAESAESDSGAIVQPMKKRRGSAALHQEHFGRISKTMSFARHIDRLFKS